MSGDGGPRVKVEQPTRIVRGLGLFLILGVAGVMLWLTWGGWPDPVVDFGHELYIPWQISVGKTLYGDIAYFEGPLSPYWNALLFRLFGVSLHVLVLGNLGLVILLSTLIYSLAVALGDRFTATTCTLLFFLLFAFGQYTRIANYTYLAPYSHALVHGLVLSVAAIHCFLLFMRCGTHFALAASGFLSGLAFLTKPEAFLALLAAMAAGFAFRGWPRRFRVGSIWSEVVIFMVFLGIPPLLAFLLLCVRLEMRSAFAGVCGSWKYVANTQVTSLKFYRTGMGTDDVLHSLLLIIAWSVGYSILLLALTRLQRLWRFRRLRVVILIASFVYMAVIAYAALVISPNNFLRSAPVALAVICCLKAMRLLRYPAGPEQDSRARLIGQVIVTAFALVLLAKMILFARIAHYGFVLGMPAMLVCVAALIHGIPDWMRRRHGSSAIFLAGVLGLLTGICGHHLHHMQTLYARKVTRVGHGQDSFLADHRGTLVQQTVEFIEGNADPDDTLVVFPIGVMINYLVRRSNPTPYVFYMPPEVILFGEESMLAALQRAPPDYVVFFHVDSSEYGLTYFGKDYAQAIFSWVESAYEDIQAFGSPPFTPGEGGVRILRRKSSK